MRRPRTFQTGLVCGLERGGLWSPYCVTIDISVRGYRWGMLTPNRMVVEEGGGHISTVTTTAPSSQLKFLACELMGSWPAALQTPEDRMRQCNEWRKARLTATKPGFSPATSYYHFSSLQASVSLGVQ